MPRIPESAHAARTLVADALTSWDLAQLADDALLIVTELVSNAVAHASGPDMRVSVALVSDRRIRVSVIDAERTRPQARPFDVERERGRGLLLVEAMSCKWGVHLLHEGKAVWAELEASL
ncbi:ATP-binding protein [Streptomyces sp. NPDC021020]|uniref:ATP-binding protein n=1 Tax=Streptomyces sp. NPDC021020 TaxID=3365109 RepID=UPI0037B17993